MIYEERKKERKSGSDEMNIIQYKADLTSNIFPDKTLYKTLFLALICGNLESVHAAADAIKTGSLPLPIQPMAVLAIQRASPSILTFCTQNGALWDPDTKKAWNGVSPIYGKAIQCDESWGERVICANGINTDYNIKKAMNAVYGERDSGSPEDGLGSKEQREGMERVMPPGWRDEICVVGFEERVREDEREIERGSWEFGNPVQPEGEDWYS